MQSAEQYFTLVCVGCGAPVTKASLPQSPNSTLRCSSCAVAQKQKAKREINQAKYAAFAKRVEPFLQLAFESHSEEWFELAGELRVDPVAIGELIEVIHEGKWRDSVNPQLYVKTNVSRRAKDMRDPFNENGRHRTDDHTINFTEYAPDITPESITGREFRHREDGHYQGKQGMSASEIRSKGKLWESVREEMAEVCLDDILQVDATLSSVVTDEDEREVLCAKALGITRERFLQGCTAVERLRRQAAWRRLSRKGTPAALRTALRHANRERLETPEWEDRALRDYHDDVYDFGCGGGRHNSGYKSAD